MWGVVEDSFTICVKKDNVCETRGCGGPTGLFWVWLICIAPTRSIKVRSYMNTRIENPSQNQDNTMMSSISNGRISPNNPVGQSCRGLFSHSIYNHKNNPV